MSRLRLRSVDGVDSVEGIGAVWWAPRLAAAVEGNVEAARKRQGSAHRVTSALVALDGCSPGLASVELARAIRREMPYVFSGQRHEILSMDEAVKRGGSGACADGAAAAAAALIVASERGAGRMLFQGQRTLPLVTVCYETVKGVPQYGHARVVVLGHPVEPWPEVRRPEAKGCALMFEVVRDES